MSLADLIEQKRSVARQMTDEIKGARNKVDKLVAQRDALQAEIQELEAFRAWKAAQP